LLHTSLTDTALELQHMKYVAGEDPARRRNTCTQYLSRVDGRKPSHTN
jgi:hypothetical protein